MIVSECTIYYQTYPANGSIASRQSMGYQFIVVRRSSQVTTITLSRPEVMNAIHPPMHAELQQALDAFAADGQQRVCVLTGAGERAFCAGSDLKFAATSESGIGAGKRAYPRSGYGGIAERFDLTKPVIAAVNGVALGGGFDRLPRQIGLKPALGIILTGRKVGAAEGKALGFVNEVVTRADLAAAVDRWTADILRCSPVATQASKEVVYRGLAEPSLADAMRNQRDYAGFRAWLESEDIREGPRAFAEKRSPNWSITRARSG